MKIVFMGTPDFAVNVLQGLIDNNYDVVGVVSQPDKEVGRKRILTPTPVKEVALKYNIPVFQPVKIRKEFDDILALEPDMIVTCAYGQIIPKEILDYPRLGCINVHGSLLPKLRGGAPIHHAIMDGLDETGITIMYMDVSMDSGDIISQRSIPITDSDNVGILWHKLSLLGRDLLLDTLPSIIDGTNDRIKQDEDKVTFGYNITKEEEKINFNDTCDNVHNKIRGLSSNPGSFTIINGKRMKVYLSERTNILSKNEPGVIEDITKDGIFVNTNDYLIKLKDIKLEGKKRCLVHEFINGIRKEDYIGERFE